MSEEENDFQPCWMYHEDVPQGRLFTDPESLEEAIESGWVDTPAGFAGPAVEPDEDGDPDPIADLGAGWFLVSHGGASEKVRGREAAEQKLAELQAAG